MEELWYTYQKQQGLSDETCREKLEILWKKETFGISTSTYTGYAAGFGAYIPDAIGLAKLGHDLQRGGNILSEFVINTHGGKSYIVLKGYPGLRKIFTGTRYLSTHAKIVQMGIGKTAVNGKIAGGSVITIILLAAYRVVDYFIRDEATWHDLLGGLAVDFAKVGTSALFASALASHATIASFAIGPLAVAVVFGVAIGFILEYLDAKYAVTSQVIETLIQFEAETLKLADNIREDLRKYSSSHDGQLRLMKGLFGVPN